jgi:hypothetical protein
MKAILTPNNNTGRNYSGEKMLVDEYILIAHDVHAYSNGTLPVRELIDLRVWTGSSPSASRYYASVWIGCNEIHMAGHGWAGGYGYCKASAASAEALSKAGVKLVSDDDKTTYHLGGAGMSEIAKAMYAIGEALGYTRDKLYLVQCRG